MNTITEKSVSNEAIALNREIKKAWLEFIGSAHPEKGKVSAAHHALYALLRGKSLAKTFPPKVYGTDIHATRNEALKEVLDFKVSAWLPFVALLNGAELAKYGYAYEKNQSNPLFDRVTAQAEQEKENSHV